MGWQEARKRYRDKESLSSQSVEDLVARRVLRGLGIVQRQLPLVERAMLGASDYDEALWPRVKRLWQSLKSSYFRIHTVEAMVVGPAHKEILERFELVEREDQVTPEFFTRPRNTKASLAYVCRLPEYVGRLPPPYKVLTEINGRHIAVLETAKYVESMGPYNLEGLEDESD